MIDPSPGQLRRDQTHTVDLRHQVDERTQDRRQQADQPRRVATVAFGQEVGDRERAELAQVRRARTATVPTLGWRAEGARSRKV